MKAPFPLNKVLPICVRATGFLKTKEDREDAIQDALEEILKYPFKDDLIENQAEAIVRTIAYHSACAIYRKNMRYARYFNTFKVFDSISGGVMDISSPEEDTFFYPSGACWTNKQQELAEEVAYRRQLARMFYSKIQLCTKKQQSIIMLLFMGCTHRELNWILGQGYKHTGSNEMGYARRRILNAVAPEIRKEIEAEYRGQPGRGYSRYKNSRRAFYVDSDGVHKYARPGSKAYEIYQTYKERDPFTVGKLLQEAGASA